MVASPQPDDYEAEIARIWQAIANLTGKDLSSAVIGAGGLTVRQGGSITMQGGNFSLADPAGDSLVANDQAAGWGIASPQIPVALFSAGGVQNGGTIFATQFTAQINGSYYTMYRGGVPIVAPKLRFGVGWTGTAGGGGAWRVQWYTSPPGAGIPNPTGGTVMASGTIPVASPGRLDESYLWPSNTFGQVVYLSFEAMANAGTPGTDWTAAYPTYCYATGTNGA
jgi:hypothetical protein